MRLKLYCTLFILIFTLGVGSSHLSYAEGNSAPRQTIRLFIDFDGGKTTLLGRHWLQLDVSQKLAMVERAREGAIQQLGVVLAKPAEVYVRELDNLFTNNPSIRHIEVGQAIHGLAISMGDWDEGKNN